MGKDRTSFFWKARNARPKLRPRNVQNVDHQERKDPNTGNLTSRFASTVGLGSRAMARAQHSGQHPQRVRQRPDGRIAGMALKKEGFGEHSVFNVKHIVPKEKGEKNYVVLENKKNGPHVRLYWVPSGAGGKVEYLFVRIHKRSVMRSILYSDRKVAMLYYKTHNIAYIEEISSTTSTPTTPSPIVEDS